MLVPTVVRARPTVGDEIHQFALGSVVECFSLYSTYRSCINNCSYSPYRAIYPCHGTYLCPSPSISYRVYPCHTCSYSSQGQSNLPSNSSSHVYQTSATRYRSISNRYCSIIRSSRVCQSAVYHHQGNRAVCYLCVPVNGTGGSLRGSNAR